MAGLTAFYDTNNYYYACISFDETCGKSLHLLQVDKGVMTVFPAAVVPLKEKDKVFLRVDFDYQELQFHYSFDQKNWLTLGPRLDATILSDDYDTLGFTGAFVGMCTQDLSGQGKAADFDWFEYSEKEKF